MTRRRGFWQSLNNAAEGFIYVVKNERNMRFHFLIGFLVLLAAIFIGVTGLEWVLLFVAVSLVLGTEMINTIVEDIADLLEDRAHPTVRIIKDVAAGIVLIVAVNALTVGFFIFSQYLSWPLEVIITKIKYTSWEITFIALLCVTFVVVFLKAFFHRGSPLLGGIVSGHSAVAFSLWTAVVFTVDNIYAVGITLLLALIVAQSRVRARIDTFCEVTLGAILGILITALLFQLFR